MWASNPRAPYRRPCRKRRRAIRCAPGFRSTRLARSRLMSGRSEMGQGISSALPWCWPTNSASTGETCASSKRPTMSRALAIRELAEAARRRLLDADAPSCGRRPHHADFRRGEAMEHCARKLLHPRRRHQQRHTYARKSANSSRRPPNCLCPISRRLCSRNRKSSDHRHGRPAQRHSF